MGTVKAAFSAAVLSSVLIGTGLQAATEPRIAADANRFPFNAIKQLALEGGGNCTLQFGQSQQVATTAAHCFDMLILGQEKFAALRNSDGSLTRISRIYIPKGYNPQDTSSKMYFDKAIVVLEGPGETPTGQFNLKAITLPLSGNQTAIPVMQAGYPLNKFGALTENRHCTLSEPQFHKNGTDFVLKHDCLIAPGDSGSAAWSQSDNSQRAIITSLNYAMPITQPFVDAYEKVVRETSTRQPEGGFVKVGYTPEPTGIKILKIDM